MRTITEVTGMSLKKIRDQLPALKKEATDALGETLGTSLREAVEKELTEKFTASHTEKANEKYTLSIRDSLTAKHTESVTAEMTAAGKTPEEIQSEMPEMVKMAVDEELPEAVKTAVAESIGSSVATEVAEKIEGELKTQMALALKEQTQSAIEAKIGEVLKLEGDKLAVFMAALSISEGKRGNIKRIVVSVPNEGEKAPSGLVEKDGKFYAIELFAEAGGAKPAPSFDSRDGGRGGRGGRDGKGGKGGGKGDKRGGRDGGGRGLGAGRSDGASAGAGASFGGGERRPRREPVAPNGEVIVSRGIIPLPEGAPRPVREPRAPRPPREPRAPRPPREPRPEVKPNGLVIVGGKLLNKADMPSVAAPATAGVAPPSEAAAPEAGTSAQS